jgi:hypothetical protein
LKEEDEISISQGETIWDPNTVASNNCDISAPPNYLDVLLMNCAYSLSTIDANEDRPVAQCVFRFITYTLEFMLLYSNYFRLSLLTFDPFTMFTVPVVVADRSLLTMLVLLVTAMQS